MSSLTCTKLTLLTVFAVLIQIIGLSLLVLGFFPIKPPLSGVSGPESFSSPATESFEDWNLTNPPPDQLKSIYLELSRIPASFDRLILMVIDGLPAEFVLGRDGEPPLKVFEEAMPYTQSLLAKGMAIGYHAKAAPPTVTMPRLKAMVSGAVGGFMDVVFNFNSQALLDDNLIGQFFRLGWKMVMFGDETWLKLFPGLFARHDGVSSFFVKDTVQVDHNVSRHLDDEINRTDWNLLILHYLGFDHVGHIGGRNSVLVGPKLKEMDEVIEKIHLRTVQSHNNDQPRTLLLVVSDHGMTESGNHGGSSYNETDSLALFVGLKNNDYGSATHETTYQVDIVPTLALLLGVPIPKNNVGILMIKTFYSLTDDQRLRALELNSWQLLRLLKAQLPNLSCGQFSSDVPEDSHRSRIQRCDGSADEMFCCLFSDAVSLHKSWNSGKFSRYAYLPLCIMKLRFLERMLKFWLVFFSNYKSRSGSTEGYSSTVLAYHDFLRTVSKWLSRRVTDKPVGLLASGIAAMLLSCLVLLGLLFQFWKEAHVSMDKWHLDGTFTLAVVLILVISMGSSSLVEEEQYIWHFMTSTLHLILLRKTLQFIMTGIAQSSSTVVKEQNKKGYVQMCSIIVILIAGRILRGWHQGGVNWTYLPDISKWLEQAGSAHMKSLQLVSWFLVISLSLCALSLLWSKRILVTVVGFVSLFLGWLVLQSIIKYQDSMLAASSYDATLMAQIVYATLGTFIVGIFIALPWLIPVQNHRNASRHEFNLTDVPSEFQMKLLLVGFRDSTYVIGWGYIFCWCLLQLLLQQPINSLPISLLLIQILSSMCYSSYGGPPLKPWVEVVALFCIGMAGHFGLGNTNTLATIDVAGAFIGVSSHSILFSGVLMFIITYASPMLALLSIVMYISVKGTGSLEYTRDADIGHLLKMNVGLPCLVPLGLNSVILIAYTIILLLMRNHLFVWSVFSPKYLYVCATTICVCIGVFIVASTGIYAFAIQRMLQCSKRN